MTTAHAYGPGARRCIAHDGPDYCGAVTLDGYADTPLALIVGGDELTITTPADVIRAAGLTMTADRVGRSTMTAGDEYRVTFDRPTGDDGDTFGEAFEYHGSGIDRDAGRTPDPADVLGSLIMDAQTAQAWEGMSEDDAADDCAADGLAGDKPSDAYRIVRGCRDTADKLAALLGSPLFFAALTVEV